MGEFVIVRQLTFANGLLYVGSIDICSLNAAFFKLLVSFARFFSSAGTFFACIVLIRVFLISITTSYFQYNSSQDACIFLIAY